MRSNQHKFKNLSARRLPRRSGFTLIEILIVVVILGILATIVIPQFSSASHQARENTLKDELRYLRTQIVVFMAQHRDRPPGYPGGNLALPATEASFLDHMTKFTDENCGVNPSATPVFRFGPYLSKMPSNPINGKATIKIATSSAEMAPDDTTGWIYNSATQEIIANLEGSDSNGTAYATY